MISMKLQTNFIEIVLRHECSPVNLLHIFGIALLKNISGRFLLDFIGRQIFIDYFQIILLLYHLKPKFPCNSCKNI